MKKKAKASINVKLYRNIQQRTDAWMVVKNKKISGTGAKAILTSKSVTPLKTYAFKLIAQQESNIKPCYIPIYLSAAVQWGQDMEPHAIKAFEKKKKLLVEEIGWAESLDPKLKGRAGASPDGIITVKEWIEVKCLNTENHIKCISENKYPSEYHSQVLNYFIINPDLEKVYFVLYDPRVKRKRKQLHIINVLRKDHEKEISEGYDKYVQFLELKDELHKKFIG